jgi:hypothetical protein
MILICTVPLDELGLDRLKRLDLPTSTISVGMMIALEFLQVPVRGCQRSYCILVMLENTCALLRCQIQERDYHHLWKSWGRGIIGANGFPTLDVCITRMRVEMFGTWMSFKAENERPRERTGSKILDTSKGLCLVLETFETSNRLIQNLTLEMNTAVLSAFICNAAGVCVLCGSLLSESVDQVLRQFVDFH